MLKSINKSIDRLCVNILFGKNPNAREKRMTFNLSDV